MYYRYQYKNGIYKVLQKHMDYWSSSNLLNNFSHRIKLDKSFFLSGFIICTSTNLIFITHQHLGQELVLHAWMVKQFIFTKQCSSASKNIKIPIWLLFTSQRCSSKQLIHISLLFCKRVYNS